MSFHKILPIAGHAPGKPAPKKPAHKNPAPKGLAPRKPAPKPLPLPHK